MHSPSHAQHGFAGCALPTLVPAHHAFLHLTPLSRSSTATRRSSQRSASRTSRKCTGTMTLRCGASAAGRLGRNGGMDIVLSGRWPRCSGQRLVERWRLTSAPRAFRRDLLLGWCAADGVARPALLKSDALAVVNAQHRPSATLCAPPCPWQSVVCLSLVPLACCGPQLPLPLTPAP